MASGVRGDPKVSVNFPVLLVLAYVNGDGVLSSSPSLDEEEDDTSSKFYLKLSEKRNNLKRNSGKKKNKHVYYNKY